MVGSVYRRGHSLTWLLALALITAVSGAVYLVTFYFDFRSGAAIAFPDILFSHDAMSAMGMPTATKISWRTTKWYEEPSLTKAEIDDAE